MEATEVVRARAAARKFTPPPSIDNVIDVDGGCGGRPGTDSDSNDVDSSYRFLSVADEAMMDISSGSNGSSHHEGMWAVFTPPPSAPPSPSRTRKGTAVPPLDIAELLSTSVPSWHAVPAGRFRHDVTTNPCHPEFAVGVNPLALGEFTHLCTGTNCQIFRSTFRGRRAVVKAILPELVDDPLVVEEFTFEMEVMARLQHDHICAAYGCGVAVGEGGFKKVPFVVLEELATLSKTFDLRGPEHAMVPFVRVLDMVLGLARALRYLHEEVFDDAMVIHRDVKLDNMATAADGRLKLIDFGLGRCVLKRQSCTEEYLMTGDTGTLRYMAPEAALNKPYTEKVDVYSFAITAWTMAENTVFLAHAKASAEFRQLVCVQHRRPAVGAGYPAAWASLLDACWHADPHQRPAFRNVVPALEHIQAAVVRAVHGCKGGEAWSAVDATETSETTMRSTYVGIQRRGSGEESVASADTVQLYPVNSA